MRDTTSKTSRLDVLFIVVGWIAFTTAVLVYYSSSLLALAILTFCAPIAIVCTIAYLVQTARDQKKGWLRKLVASFRMTLSLVAVATLILLVASYALPRVDHDIRFRANQKSYQPGDRGITLKATRGMLEFRHFQFTSNTLLRRTVIGSRPWGFQVVSYTRNYTDPKMVPDPTLFMSDTIGHLSLWIVFPLLFAYPTIYFLRGPFRRNRRRKKGLCIHCGYNLTGNTTGTCPECGEKT